MEVNPIKPESTLDSSTNAESTSTTTLTLPDRETARDRRNRFLYPAILLMVAAGLRIWSFPERYETRNNDEIGYLRGSLNLLEGIAPGMKAAPAGPTTWMGWCYAGGAWISELARSDANLRTYPLQVRPFMALDRVLFNLHRDLSSIRQFELYVALALGLITTLAGWRLGLRQGGLPGAILLGAFIAGMPLILDHAAMARPYALAWYFGILAVCCATGTLARRPLWTCLMMGLAIASRVEMLLLLPFLGCVYWAHTPVGGRRWRASLKMLFFSLVVAMLVAPWLVTNLIGNLRAIATIRLADFPGKRVGPMQALVEGGWENALMAPLLICLAALPVYFRKPRPSGLIPLIYALALVPTTFRGGAGFHQNGPVAVALILAGVYALGALRSRYPRGAMAAAAFAALLALGQGVWVLSTHQLSHPEDVTTGWIQANVPAGSHIYVTDGIWNALPSIASSDAIWGEMTNLESSRKKFQLGLKRFNLVSSDLPRALSEENMVQERGNRRAWFILGSVAQARDARRYNVHLIWSSPLDERDFLKRFISEGGYLVWHENAGGPPPASLGEPVTAWRMPSKSILIYHSKGGIPD